MKKKKVAVFAVLGVLAIGGLGAGIISAEGGLTQYVNGVGAKTVCNLKWDGSNQPTKKDYKWTGLNSTIRTKYSSVNSVQKGSHVVLNGSGSMETTGEEYGSVTPNVGGRVNGLSSIVVNFKTSSGTYNPAHDDYYNSPADFHTELRLIAKHADVVVKEVKLESGVPVTFEGKIKPNTFKLQAKEIISSYIDPSFEPDKPVTVTINDVSISCSEEVTYTVNPKINPTNYKDLEWFYDDAMDANDDPLVAKTTEDVRTTVFTNNQPVSVRSKKNENPILTTVEVKKSGTTEALPVETIAGVNGENSTYKFNVTGDVDVSLYANTYTDIYAGRDIVGTYKMFAYQSKQPTTYEVSFDAKGKLKFNNDVYDYKLDSNENVTVPGTKINVTKKGDVLFIEDAASFTHIIGIKDASTQVTALRYYAGASIFEFTYTGKKQIATILDKKNIIVNGYNNEIIELVGGTTIADAKLFIIKDKLVDNKSALTGLEGVYTNGANEEVRYEAAYVSGLKLVAKSEEAGTYTGAKGDLVLDGFDTYTLGNENGTYTYDKSKHIVNCGDYLLILDLTANTYTVKEFVKVDPWQTTAMSYTCPELKGTLTFDKGKVTMKSTNDVWSQATKKPVDYTFDKGVVSFEFTWINPSDEYWETARFEGEITDLVNFKTIKFANGVRTVENSSVLKSGLSLTYVEPVVETLLLKEGTYKSSTSDLVVKILNATQAEVSGPYWLQCSSVTYKTDRVKNIITMDLEWGMQTQAGNSSGTATLKLNVVSDTKATLASNLTAVDYMAELNETLIKKGTEFNRELDVSDVFTLGTYKSEQGDSIVFGDKVSMPGVVWVEDGWTGTYNVDLTTKKITFNVKANADYLAQNAEYPGADDVAFEFEIISKTQIKLLKDATCTYYDGMEELGTKVMMKAGTILNLVP